MRRWLTALTSAAAVAAPVVAQQVNTHKPGYVVVRVKMSGEGGGSGGTGTGSGDADIGEGGGSGPPRGPGGRGGGVQSGPGPGSPSSGGGFGGGSRSGGVQGGPGQGGGPPAPGGIGGVGGGIGGPGVPGVPGFPGGGQGGPGGTANTAANERSVHVLIPYSRLNLREPLFHTKMPNKNTNPEYATIHHQFGQSILYPNKTNLQVEFLPFTTEEQRLKDAFARWSVDTNRKPTVLLAYIGDALKAELVGVAEQFSDSLAKQYETEKDLPADVAAYIKGYNTLKAKWNEPAPNNPAADTWKAKFGPEANVHTDAPHYAVIHFSGDSLSGQAGETVSIAADLLEKNLKSFYLWHLREGFALPLPDKRLVAVVAKSGSQLGKLREGLDGLPVTSDSFYSPAHNLIVLSPERTDELGRTFNAIAATKLEGYDRGDLLKGKNPALKKEQSPDEIAIASTYALVRRALEDEALRAAISREGTRQLFVTLGIVPQHVRLPKWVESGVGSVLQHPRSGGVVEVSAKDGPGIVVGVNTGHGAANYELLYEFLQFYPAKKDGKENKSIDAPAVLTNVLTDKYFSAVASGIDLDRPSSITDMLPMLPGMGGGAAPTPGGAAPGGAAPVAPGGVGPSAPGLPGRGGRGNDAQGPGPRGGPGQPPGVPGGPGGPPSGIGQGTQHGDGDGIIDTTATNPILTPAQLDQKAKATAWALVFYLTKNGKLSKLQTYLAKLGELPRDMRVDREISMKLFCETFGLLKPNSQEVDKGAFNTFAKDWMAFMHQQSPTYQTLTLKKLNSDAGGGNGQGGSGPGGIPGVPGPGVPGGGPGAPGVPGGGPGGRPGGGGPGGRGGPGGG